MKTETVKVELPLKWKTPDSWAESAMSDVIALLDDHAHLEKKAATNAMDLINRWPQPEPPIGWVTTLASIARDETDHLFKVSKLMAQRGHQLSRFHTSEYAAALRPLVRMGKGWNELVDRLLVSALIELRSCERFEILGRLCQDEVLQKLYKALWGSEHNHYKVFLKLARSLPKAAREDKEAITKRQVIVDQRWEQLLQFEADIMQAQPTGARLHSKG
jgi:tRNA 2-(methylsulfanyl)-N6-isopentenyladenosine37 hydroxylase